MQNHFPVRVYMRVYPGVDPMTGDWIPEMILFCLVGENCLDELRVLFRGVKPERIHITIGAGESWTWNHN